MSRPLSIITQYRCVNWRCRHTHHTHMMCHNFAMEFHQVLVPVGWQKTFFRLILKYVVLGRCRRRLFFALHCAPTADKRNRRDIATKIGNLRIEHGCNDNDSFFFPQHIFLAVFMLFVFFFRLSRSIVCKWRDVVCFAFCWIGLFSFLLFFFIFNWNFFGSSTFELVPKEHLFECPL